ncbi:hypothetical protein Patl1_17848 [Pistacia atlantica]|uniref:Uncharacterized protein n=1 Tax=Pistacia atlantica TaxID=434234 RepID=A0ACC1BYZ0_9ROSI|nr:hypothetical protein Patl1_17848 [Pistacia atlantica]
MANVGGRRWPGERIYSHKPIIQDFVPSSAWNEDANGHYLLMDLPDFQKEQVKLHADPSGSIMVSGERLTNDKSRIIRFEQTFKLPPNSDIDQITGKFDGEILYVTVPKLVEAEKQQEVPERETENISSSSNITEEIKEESSHHHHHKDENVNRGHAEVHGKEEHERQSDKNQMCSSRVDSFDKEDVEKWAKQPSQLDWAMKILRKNKGIVVTAMIAFSLGVYVSRKFGPAAAVLEAAPFD